MKQKIVFFDIDGTLLPFHAKALPESTVQALAALRENGVKTLLPQAVLALMAMYAPAVLISYTVANTFLLLQFLLRRMLLLLMQPAVIIWNFCLRDQIIFILICPYL